MEGQEMAWFSRFTRFGDMHWVFGQENSISCGVACVIMAAFKINKLQPNTKSIFTEKDIIKNATALFGPNPLGSYGLGNGQLMQLLNHPDLRMGGWMYSNLPRNDIPAHIAKKVGISGSLGPILNVTPMIAGIDWSGGGGHWVLIDTVREFNGQKYATVCDPWDANVHIVPLNVGTPFNYTGQKAFGVDFGGTHHAYTTPSKGSVFLGDILVR
jgi:hypothetical protein